MDSNKIFAILAICILGAGAYMLVYNNHQQPSSPYQTAKLVTSSLFESYPFLNPIEMYRIVYQYDRSAIPSTATYFYVNITIPQEVVQKLDQYAQNYPYDASLIPLVYAVTNDQVNSKFTNFVNTFNVHIINTDQYGVPTKIQAVFKTSDVPSTDNYVIVVFPIPYTNFFQKLNTVTNPAVGTNVGDNWTVLVGGSSTGGFYSIVPAYFANRYSSYKAIHLHGYNYNYAVQSYILLSKSEDIPVDPNKPLYVYSALYWTTSYSDSRWAVLIGMEFVNVTGDTYKVLLVRGTLPNPIAAITSKFDCVVHIPTNIGYTDAASYIRTTCNNLDWNKITKIDKIYIGGDIYTGSGTSSDLWIYGFSIANNKYIQLLTS